MFIRDPVLKQIRSGLSMLGKVVLSGSRNPPPPQG